MDSLRDTRITTYLLPDVGDFGRGSEQQCRTSNVHIEYSDDKVTIFGTGLYPLPVDRWRVKSLKAWIE